MRVEFTETVDEHIARTTAELEGMRRQAERLSSGEKADVASRYEAMAMAYCRRIPFAPPEAQLTLMEAVGRFAARSRLMRRPLTTSAREEAA
jgi:hypothetical protein